MARPKKKEEEKRIRLDITISKDEAAKLEEISRITGLKRSVIISKMIETTELETALEYARLKKMMLASVWGAKGFVPKVDTDNTQWRLSEVDEEDEKAAQEQWNKDIEIFTKICREKWGLEQ